MIYKSHLDENGAVTLPLGTISIEETKAPTGYLLKGNTLNVTDTATGTTSTVEDSNYVAQVTKEFKEIGRASCRERV